MPKIGNELKHHFVHIISFPMTPYSPVSHLPMLGKVIGQVHMSIIKGYTCNKYSVYGHTTRKAPVPVRSPKLNLVGPSQYLVGRPPWNTRCCRLFSFYNCYYYYYYYYYFYYFPTCFLLNYRHIIQFMSMSFSQYIIPNYIKNDLSFNFAKKIKICEFVLISEVCITNSDWSIQLQSEIRLTASLFQQK